MPAHNKETAQHRDVYADITNQLIAAIEADPGKPSIPWRRSAGPLFMPVNTLTKNGYHGINIVSLWVAAELNEIRSRVIPKVLLSEVFTAGPRPASIAGVSTTPAFRCNSSWCPLRAPRSVLPLNQAPISGCHLCALCREVGRNREVDGIACLARFGNHSYPITKLDQTFGPVFTLSSMTTRPPGKAWM